MEDRIEENGIVFELVGDYYIPVLKLLDEERAIGKRIQTHGLVADYTIY